MLPVSACTATPHRFGTDWTPGLQVPFSPSVSGVFPSIMYSNEPDVSSRMRTFGSGTLAAPSWAFALSDTRRVATANANAPTGNPSRDVMWKRRLDIRITSLLAQKHLMGPPMIRARELWRPSERYEPAAIGVRPTPATVNSMKHRPWLVLYPDGGLFCVGSVSST